MTTFSDKKSLKPPTSGHCFRAPYLGTTQHARAQTQQSKRTCPQLPESWSLTPTLEGWQNCTPPKQGFYPANKIPKTQQNSTKHQETHQHTHLFTNNNQTATNHTPSHTHTNKTSFPPPPNTNLHIPPLTKVLQSHRNHRLIWLLFFTHANHHAPLTWKQQNCTPHTHTHPKYNSNHHTYLPLTWISTYPPPLMWISSCTCDENDIQVRYN